MAAGDSGDDSSEKDGPQNSQINTSNGTCLFTSKKKIISVDYRRQSNASVIQGKFVASLMPWFQLLHEQLNAG